MAKIVCKILGSLFFVIGVLGLTLGEDTHRYHALVHITTGLVALYFGFVGSRLGAKRACIMLGVFYLLALGVVGLVSLATGNPAMRRLWNPGPLDMGLGDYAFHIVIGAIFLAGSLINKKQP